MTDAPTPPLAKPSAPAQEKDPPGIAASIIKQGGQGPALDAVDQARKDEELAALDSLPSAAEQKN